MEFKIWLEENLGNKEIQFFMMKDGRVFVTIKGKRYEYITDPLYHTKWKRMIPYQPYNVLRQIEADNKVLSRKNPPQFNQPTLF